MTVPQPAAGVPTELHWGAPGAPLEHPGVGRPDLDRVPGSGLWAGKVVFVPGVSGEFHLWRDESVRKRSREQFFLPILNPFLYWVK